MDQYTRIRHDLPTTSNVILCIYDVTGRTVRVLRQGLIQSAGTHEVTWDGRNDAGRSVASGTYFCRLEAGLERKTSQMVLVR